MGTHMQMAETHGRATLPFINRLIKKGTPNGIPFKLFFDLYYDVTGSNSSFFKNTPTSVKG